MKKITFILLAALAVLPQTVSGKKVPGPDTLSVMSFNIRMGEGKDGTNSWQYRCPATIYMLRDKHPDIFGLQEAYDYQVLFIKENLREYNNVGVGREDGKHKGEHMSIFYNKKKVSLLKWGTFWLSDTPGKPSKGWDAACIRTATWALMKDKRSGRKFYYVNTHLDHVSDEARNYGAEVIVQKLGELEEKYPGVPVVLTGDFNTAAESLPYNTLTAAGFADLYTVADDGQNVCSYQGWGAYGADEGLAIDFIFAKGAQSASVCRVLSDMDTDISDHYPVMAVIDLGA